MLNCLKTYWDPDSFICNTYSSKHASGTADEMRYILFCQKQKRNENLPPTSASLKHHVERAYYQALVWKSSLKRQTSAKSTKSDWARLDCPKLHSHSSSHVRRSSGSCIWNSHHADIKNQFSGGVIFVCTEACLCMAGEACETAQ